MFSKEEWLEVWLTANQWLQSSRKDVKELGICVCVFVCVCVCIKSSVMTLSLFHTVSLSFSLSLCAHLALCLSIRLSSFCLTDRSLRLSLLQQRTSEQTLKRIKIDCSNFANFLFPHMFFLHENENVFPFISISLLYYI